MPQAGLRRPSRSTLFSGSVNGRSRRKRKRESRQIASGCTERARRFQTTKTASAAYGGRRLDDRYLNVRRDVAAHFTPRKRGAIEP
jgi:hypothetical protein